MLASEHMSMPVVECILAWVYEMVKADIYAENTSRGRGEWEESMGAKTD